MMSTCVSIFQIFKVFSVQKVLFHCCALSKQISCWLRLISCIFFLLCQFTKWICHVQQSTGSPFLPLTALVITPPGNNGYVVLSWPVEITSINICIWVWVHPCVSVESAVSVTTGLIWSCQYRTVKCLFGVTLFSAAMWQNSSK